MRPTRLATALLLVCLAVPLAHAGGTASCEIIPHIGPWIGAFDSCTMTFTVTGAGPMVFQVEAVAQNYGNVVFDADGPGNARVAVDCPLLGSAGWCGAVFNNVIPGPWTVTAHAQVAYATRDAWLRASVTYP